MRDAIDLYLILKTVDETMSWRHFFEERSRDGTERLCSNLLAAAVAWLDQENGLPHLRYELASKGCRLPATEFNPLKRSICRENLKGEGRQWYLQESGGGKVRYWLHTSMAVVINQEFPFNLARTAIFRRFLRNL